MRSGIQQKPWNFPLHIVCLRLKMRRQYLSQAQFSSGKLEHFSDSVVFAVVWTWNQSTCLTWCLRVTISWWSPRLKILFNGRQMTTLWRLSSRIDWGGRRFHDITLTRIEFCWLFFALDLKSSSLKASLYAASVPGQGLGQVDHTPRPSRNSGQYMRLSPRMLCIA